MIVIIFSSAFLLMIPITGENSSTLRIIFERVVVCLLMARPRRVFWRQSSTCCGLSCGHSLVRRWVISVITAATHVHQANQSILLENVYHIKYFKSNFKNITPSIYTFILKQNNAFYVFKNSLKIKRIKFENQNKISSLNNNHHHSPYLNSIGNLNGKDLDG